MIREINVSVIKQTVKELLIEANLTLSDDVCAALETSRNDEPDDTARSVLSTLAENLQVAKKSRTPICQDTGMAVVFLDIGQDVHITGGLLEDAVNEGVSEAYIEGYLRKSVVSEPLYERKNTNDNTPAVIHTRLTAGDKIKLTVAPKGFGSENMSAIRMLNPSADENDVIAAVDDIIKTAGSRPCPPVILGIGIGGTFEFAAELAKRALLRPLDKHNPDPRYAALERKILDKINKSGIGPQGFGGKTTSLGVSIEYYPTHIAGLPLAVNVCCHVSRHKSTEI